MLKGGKSRPDRQNELVNRVAEWRNARPPMNLPHIHARRRKPLEGVTSAERMVKNELIVKRRREKLIGRTVTGTIHRVQKMGKTNFWIRWNSCKSDEVYVSAALAERALKNMVSGETRVECTITDLGPELSKLKGNSAWCMHPQCKDCKIVPGTPRAVKDQHRSASSLLTLHPLERSSCAPLARGSSLQRLLAGKFAQGPADMQCRQGSPTSSSNMLLASLFE